MYKRDCRLKYPLLNQSTSIENTEHRTFKNNHDNQSKRRSQKNVSTNYRYVMFKVARCFLESRRDYWIDSIINGIQQA